MNDKPEIEIKIFGGTNMIVPTGTTAVQNFYGDQFAEVAIRPEATTGIESLSDDECHLFTYVPDVKKCMSIPASWANVPVPTIWPAWWASCSASPTWTRIRW